MFLGCIGPRARYVIIYIYHHHVVGYLVHDIPYNSNTVCIKYKIIRLEEYLGGLEACRFHAWTKIGATAGRLLIGVLYCSFMTRVLHLLHNGC